MKRAFFSSLIATFCAVAIAAGDEPSFQLNDVLQAGAVELEVMTIGFSDRATELSQKFLEAVAKNRDWFLEYTKNATPGKPLKYDRRLGLTKDEYEEYLVEAKNPTFQSTGKVLRAEFIVEDEVLKIGLGDDSNPLNEIRLNFDTTELTASTGKIGKGIWKSSDRTDIPIGPGEGYTWKHEAGDLDAFEIRLVSLEILRRKESG